MIRTIWKRLLLIAMLGIIVSSSNAAIVHGQSVSAEAKISLSGGERVSQNFTASSGDSLSVDYAVDSSNESSCVEVSLEFKPAFPMLPVKWANRSSTLGPYSQRSNATWGLMADSSGTLSASYSACPTVPECKGKVSLDTTYSLDILSIETAKNNSNVAGTYLIGMLVFAIATVVLLAIIIYPAIRKPHPPPDVSSGRPATFPGT